MPQIIEELKAARARVASLEAALNKCRHEFITYNETIGTRSRPSEFGEDPPQYWVLEQHRGCKNCGMSQVRTKVNPDSNWSDWTPSN